MNPRYSFIIPAYNEEALIGRTLDVLRESAAQLQGGFEIIVANDDSSDRTPEIAREKGAKVIDVKKRQIAAVRNAGRHQHVVFLLNPIQPIRLPARHLRRQIVAQEEGETRRVDG